MEPMMWLILFIVLLVIEIVTLGLTTIWLAAGALAALLVSALGGPVWLQWVLFVVVSAVLLVFTRPLATRWFNASREKTNVEGLIGKHAIVTERIENLSETGQVRINGLEWSARTESDTEVIEKGAKVEILQVQGVKLICKVV